jgi:hypothetical protein
MGKNQGGLGQLELVRELFSGVGRISRPIFKIGISSLLAMYVISSGVRDNASNEMHGPDGNTVV